MGSSREDVRDFLARLAGTDARVRVSFEAVVDSDGDLLADGFTYDDAYDPDSNERYLTVARIAEMSPKIEVLPRNWKIGDVVLADNGVVMSLDLVRGWVFAGSGQYVPASVIGQYEQTFKLLVRDGKKV